MRHIAAILAPLLVALGLIAGAQDAANADTPGNVRAGHAAALDAGWVRVACATTHDGARCAVRVPDGASRVTLVHRIDGQLLGVEDTYPYADDHRRTPARRQAATGNVAGVAVSCRIAGRAVDCVLDYPAGARDLNVTTYVNGWNYGGLRGKGIVL